jgi:hypothetical protein
MKKHKFYKEHVYYTDFWGKDINITHYIESNSWGGGFEGGTRFCGTHEGIG